MNIAIFGLGYAGCVSAACLADMGDSVIEVDVNHKKLEMICTSKNIRLLVKLPGETSGIEIKQPFSPSKLRH